MDGTGRTTKRNRRFLRKIVPYTSILSKELIRPANPSAGAVIHEVLDEITSELHDKDTQNVQKSTVIQMTDADFNAGSTNAVHNVQHNNQPSVKLPAVQPPKTDKQTRPSRVKFQTQRYRQQF